MKLSKEDAARLKDIDIIEQTRAARRDSMNLLDEQGLAALALAVANILDKIIKEPESIIKEYAK
ncbi:hypothetical protein L0337_12585 [candidate division KSB1 bacterium]|nr:hypothetical protein [candidate division KSB1 bacterium]